MQGVFYLPTTFQVGRECVQATVAAQATVSGGAQPTQGKLHVRTRTNITTGQPLISDQVIIAIIGAIALILPALYTARLNGKLAKAKLDLDAQTAQLASQDTKLNKAQSLITAHGEEQERLKATATRLADEAKERGERYKAEREADRLAQKEAAERLKEAADYYQKRWEDEAKITNEQRVEIKGLTEQAIEAIKNNDKLQREFSASDRAHTEDIERLKKKTEDFDKLHAQFELTNNMLTSAQTRINEMQTNLNAMNDRFDADIEKINTTNDKIIAELKKRVNALETENADLRKQISKLRSDLKIVSDEHHQPEPPPGKQAPIPVDFEPQVKLPPTGTEGL